MQPIVFLKAIVPFTSSIIDLSADTSSASSLSNGRHPRSSAPFHPSFFFLSGVSVPPSSLVGFSPLLSRGFQSPFVSHGVSVPLRLCGVSVPLRFHGFHYPVGFQSPFVSRGFHSPVGFHRFSPPSSSMGFIPSWGFSPPFVSSLLCLCGPLPLCLCLPPFTLDTSAWCIAAYNRASPPHPLDMHHICPHRLSHTPARFPSDSPLLASPRLPPPPPSTMGHALPATAIRVPPPPFHLPCLSTGIYQHCTVLPTVCAEGEFLIS
jgi:hypothetical protein